MSFKEFYGTSVTRLTENNSDYFRLRNDVDRFKSLWRDAKNVEARLAALMYGLTALLECELEKLTLLR